MKQVLVVDDDEPIRQLVADALEDEGYRVQQAANGQEGLERLEEAPPDVVVLDLMMPVMDGWTFVEACRELPRCAEMPIVVMSAAHGLHQSAERLRDSGVRAVLAKPFDLDALLGIVERLTRNHAA